MNDLATLGIDTHAHLDLKQFRDDLEQVLNRAQGKGLQKIRNVFLGPEAYENRPVILDEWPFIFFILGIHPHDAEKANQGTIQKIEKITQSDFRLRAVGEIGLDFYWMRSQEQSQINTFRDQLALAKSIDYPVVIHSRQAETECLEILLDMGFKDRPLLWHCFSRETSFAEKILANGWTISLPGIITYKNASGLQAAVKEIPLSRTVIETDCPFLTPEPYRPKRNEPSYIIHTAKKVAELKGTSLEKVWETTADNARHFFQLT